jgi:hypothetical protein
MWLSKSCFGILLAALLVGCTAQTKPDPIESANIRIHALAAAAPRGAYPRGFTEQVYWTLVGIDDGPMPALLSEDGALQPGKTSFSIEPFLLEGDKLTSWADVTITQSLLDDYLPIPSVDWKRGEIELGVTTFAVGTREHSQVIARYQVRNTGDSTRALDLVLAIRPFQVNPPAQFLNTRGGVSPMHDVSWDGAQVQIDGDARVVPLAAPSQFFAHAASGAAQALVQRPWPQMQTVHDDNGYAAAALIYHLDVPAHGASEVALLAPLTGAAQLPPAGMAIAAWLRHEQDEVARRWHERLNRVTLNLPAAPHIANALRTALAHILISRDGFALRPGTRSYARSWIRDGAMMADALLRLGETEAVRDYVDWYAAQQFADGKVPCCVDQRGADPTPENDSHGELIHAIAQLYRYGGDRAQLEKNWLHVESAIAYMERLRASETEATDVAFKGLMPASISHEGYSAKPMHSYWDDFWALTGYADAAAMAQVLNRTDASHYTLAHDAFTRDLHASIASATRSHAIDFVPGCAELGDFDATSTTIAFAPAGEAPSALLRNTFERYWHEFVARRDGDKAWEDYTPYEWRTVGSLVRLGWRERAQEATNFFFGNGARPHAWNQWAEVVGHDPRKPRFIGDMPHAWVASDFMRSMLDLFAYERGDTLVLAAGVQPTWMNGAGMTLEHLRTPYGELSYRLQRDGRRLELHIAAGVKPSGGMVLPWPLPGSPGAARINGVATQWHENELHIDTAPAIVTIDLAATD